MNATELRIGNLVSIEAEIVTIEDIHEDGINQIIDSGWYGSWVVSYEGYFEDSYTFKNIQKQLILPIPLTEEWLPKLGVKNIGVNYNGGQIDISENLFLIVREYKGTWNVYLKEKKNNDLLIEIINAKIHQIQNLYFTLTGEELEVK